MQRWLGIVERPMKRAASEDLAQAGKKGVLSMSKITLLRRNKAQKGQGLVEYALIIALVAVIVIAILIVLGPQIGKIFSTITLGL